VDASVPLSAGCCGWSGRVQGLPRAQAVARSRDHFQPGGIFKIRRRAWVIIRAGADRMGNRRVLVEALVSSPSSARWRSQAVSEVARAASCSQALLRS
jgi:hypothetical protein